MLIILSVGTGSTSIMFKNLIRKIDNYPKKCNIFVITSFAKIIIEKNYLEPYFFTLKLITIMKRCSMPHFAGGGYYSPFF